MPDYNVTTKEGRDALRAEPRYYDESGKPSSEAYRVAATAYRPTAEGEPLPPLETLRARGGIVMTMTTLQQQRDRLLDRVDELERALADLRPAGHYECEDPWYSCPASGQCARELGSEQCDCSKDAYDAQLRALGLLKEKTDV